MAPCLICHSRAIFAQAAIQSGANIVEHQTPPYACKRVVREVSHSRFPDRVMAKIASSKNSPVWQVDSTSLATKFCSLHRAVIQRVWQPQLSSYTAANNLHS